MFLPFGRATNVLLFTLLPVVCEALDISEVALKVSLEVPNVTLSNGAVLMGASHMEGTVSYWNIQYATSERFEKAAPWSPPPGTTVNGMGEYETSCAQQPHLDSLEFIGVEDCLFLDVSAPSDADGAAVMVWIHGGGLFTGSKNDYAQGMLHMVSEGGVLVVAINYRLGFFGFFTGSGPDAPPANNGIRDQIFALEWVRDNIAQFGGDASRVTIFGESAGALSVTVLHQSPLARGLFHRAIGMSPAWQNTAQFHHSSAVVAGSLAKQCLEESGCGSINCLKAKNISEIAVMAVHFPGCEAFFDATHFIPVIGAYFTGFDGEVLEHSAYDKYCSAQPVASAEVPLMVGNLPHEWRRFEDSLPSRYSIHKFLAEYVPTYLDGDADTQECFREALLSHYSNASAFSTCPDCKQFAGKESEMALATDIEVTLGAQLAASSVGGPRYRFLFDIEGDGSPMGSQHGADVNYMLDVLDDPTQVQKDFSRMQREYFFTFAKVGAPSSSLGPVWQSTRSGSLAVPLLHMRLGSESSAVSFDPWFNKASAEMLSKIACGHQDIPEFQHCLPMVIS